MLGGGGFCDGVCTVGGGVCVGSAGGVLVVLLCGGVLVVLLCGGVVVVLLCGGVAGVCGASDICAPDFLLCFSRYI